MHEQQPFEALVQPWSPEGLRPLDLLTVQVNLGYRCNQLCTHCHLEAGPDRSETMDIATLEAVVSLVFESGCAYLDITGGAPEMHPALAPLIKRTRERVREIQVRTNLTVFAKPGMRHWPDFYRSYGVQLVASLPCYLEPEVRQQRGSGVFETSIAVLRQLNELGYGRDPLLALNLVYNPLGAFLPPRQDRLEREYRQRLGVSYGITFTRLLTITNVPLGRFRGDLRRQDQERTYMELLRASFNPETIQGLMCRHQINIGWDGRLYDCDFNQAIGWPLDPGVPQTVWDFHPSTVLGRKIVTGDHCFACTAGYGSSCGGALL
ncbi:MAG: arsenosugar biosynthesis radical SAM protein ArsS [Coprothermobacterota bacterium]|nr:arsenosugar biosynthesis radical SAM protein ArsS [Coprothermobacterota bacterium]